MNISKPIQSPSNQGAGPGGSAEGEAKPKELSAEELAAGSAGAGGAAGPTLIPPQVSGVGGITAWVSDKRVNALFGINQNRNSWVGIAGVGWKKLANNSDSAVVALTILAAHAKQMQTSYSYREEADGMIHECYVW